MTELTLPSYVNPVTGSPDVGGISKHALACKQRHQQLLKYRMETDPYFRETQDALFERSWRYKNSMNLPTLETAQAFMREATPDFCAWVNANCILHNGIIDGNCVAMLWDHKNGGREARAFLITADYRMLRVPTPCPYVSLSELVAQLESDTFREQKKAIFRERLSLPIHEYDSQHVLRVVDNDTEAPLYKAHATFYAKVCAYEKQHNLSRYGN